MTNIIPDKEYPPANICIYCGDTEPPLGDEHVLPFGLGGNLIIPRASCRACEKETGRMERICLRTMFGPYRIRTGIQTRNPEDRKKSYPLSIIDSNGKISAADLPLPEHPAFLVMPRFEGPNVFSGEPPVDPKAPFNYQLLTIASEEEKARADALASQSGAAGVHVGSADIAAFARMLAKIAHAFVYAETNGFSDGFRPLLKETILGEFPIFQHFVGVEPNKSLDPIPSELHRMGWRTIRVNNVEYHVADIRLFSTASTPTYRVAVAERQLEATKPAASGSRSNTPRIQ